MQFSIFITGIVITGTVLAYDNNIKTRTEPTENFTTSDLLLSAGNMHSCFLNSSRIVCWGERDLGNCDPPEGYFRAVSCGSWHTCAIDVNGLVKCFGSGYALQDLPPKEPVFSISSGFAATCGVLSKNSSLICWGHGVDRAQIPPGRFVAVSVGTRSACALREADGSIMCWGADEFGQVSQRPSGTHSTISCGGGHCCALTVDGRAVCWGGSDNYARGRTAPQLRGRVTQVAAGEDHACVLAEDGRVACWGKCAGGVCDPPASDGPVRPYALIAAGGAHTCGLRLTEAVVDCWGRVPGGPEAVPPGPMLLQPAAAAAAGWVEVSGAGPAQQAQQVAPADKAVRDSNRVRVEL
jgi:alpha-tubulin suppressor-like RCC1 family protein